MKVTDIGVPPGANKRLKRVGRGSGSGHGKTSCRGHKGSGQRKGTMAWPGFEGGQMPLIRRLPKKGFNPLFKESLQIVNVENLNRFDKGSTVGPAEFKQCGLITSDRRPVKILGDGKLSKELTVRAHGISKSAARKIREAGAKFEMIRTEAKNTKDEKGKK